MSRRAAADLTSTQPGNDIARRILHCDMDCFYAAVHMRDEPSLVGRPLVIGGDPAKRGVVMAANYEARTFGIHSAMPSAQARRRCPQILFLSPEFRRYRAESREIFTIFRQFTPVVQTVSLDEAYLDVTECLSDFGSATAVARAIKQRVVAERRLTVSVGVGPNRLVAKIASDFDKPDGLTVVPPGRVVRFLAPLPVRMLQGVGPATEKRLRAMGVETVEQLRTVSLRGLSQRFGRYGETLHRFARGVDDREVHTHQERKSYSSERTYDRDLEGLEQMDAEIGRLAHEVGDGMGRRGLVGRTITLKVRYSDFTTVTRSRTLRLPTDDAEHLAVVARDLLRCTGAVARPVRLLGLGVAKFGRGDDGQLALFGGSAGASAGEPVKP